MADAANFDLSIFSRQNLPLCHSARSYDQLIEKLERERKEEHDHASEKEDLKAQIADLEKECLKFEDLIKERESQLVEKEVENEDLVRELNEKEKQIFLHQELERDIRRGSSRSRRSSRCRTRGSCCRTPRWKSNSTGSRARRCRSRTRTG